MIKRVSIRDMSGSTTDYHDGQDISASFTVTSPQPLLKAENKTPAPAGVLSYDPDFSCGKARVTGIASQTRGMLGKYAKHVFQYPVQPQVPFPIRLLKVYTKEEKNAWCWHVNQRPHRVFFCTFL